MTSLGLYYHLDHLVILEGNRISLEQNDPYSSFFYFINFNLFLFFNLVGPATAFNLIVNKLSCKANWLFSASFDFFFLSEFSFTNIHDSQDTRGRGGGIYLTPPYHFHPLHRHLDISWAITAESSPLHITSSRTRTGNVWFLGAICGIAWFFKIILLNSFWFDFKTYIEKMHGTNFCVQVFLECMSTPPPPRKWNSCNLENQNSFKVGLSPYKNNCVICFNESPLKVMKNVFCFILKALFVLKIFRFLTGLFGHFVWTFCSKFMTSQPDSQIITVHILPNISRCKVNEAMKFGHLIENNKINIFL